MTAKPTKPAYGAPACNGCGACCQAVPCPLGAMLFEVDDGPCPALEDQGARFGCGLMLHPRKYAPVRAALLGSEPLIKAAALCIGSGIGCDAQLEGEADDPEYRKRLRIKGVGQRGSDVALALVSWLGSAAHRKLAEYQNRIGA